MKNISAHMLAKKYAQAFFNVFGSKITEKKSNNVEDAYLFLSKNKDKLFYLGVPHVPAEIKIDVLHKILIDGHKLPTVFEKLIKLLVRDKRAPLIRLVLKQLVALYRQKHNIVFFEITSSHPLTQDQLDNVEQFLARETGCDIIYKYEVDNRLIAGLRLQSNLFVWEYSIRKHLDSLRGLTRYN